MPILYNIDIQDQREGTKYPFAATSTMRLGPQWLNPASVTSLTLYVNPGHDGVAHISRVYSNPDLTSTVEFADSKGSVIAQTVFPTISKAPSTLQHTEFITRPNGVLAGVIVVSPELPRALYTLLQQTGGMLRPSQGDLVIDPRCLVAMPAGVLKSIYLAPEYYTENIELKGSDQAISPRVKVGTTGNAITIELEQDAAVTVVKGITEISLNGGSTSVNVAGKHIWLKHTKLSNLRVITGVDSSLSLMGVTYAD